MDYSVKIGFAPTRRSIFSIEDALQHKKRIMERLDKLGAHYVDMEDINEEGLLHLDEDVPKVVEKFKKGKVDALFFPHCNFGSEYLVGRVAKELNLPILLWGPRDEAPLPDGARLRDTQCGLFASGKVLRRFNLPFTYIPNCNLEEEVFERGFQNFIAAVNVVKEFRKIRILQISTRPAPFWTGSIGYFELYEAKCGDLCAGKGREAGGRSEGGDEKACAGVWMQRGGDSVLEFPSGRSSHHALHEQFPSDG